MRYNTSVNKILFWIGVVILASSSIVLLLPPKQKHQSDISKPSTSGVSVTPVKAKNLTKSLFVPYWTLSGDINTSGFNRLIYFGVPADENGLIRSDPGYTGMDRFLALTRFSSARRLLGIRMLDTKTNNLILGDANAQRKIISQSISLAKSKGFSGIVLDFEISALGFGQITKNISIFENSFGESAKNNRLEFFPAIYGDTFSRLRPFDVKAIGDHSTGIMIMAYDFHKAGGNPGPNFPLDDNQSEGYDFRTMIGDFLQQVPAGKITVIFGLYGYDWTIDDKGNAAGAAVPMSDNEIDRKFPAHCTLPDCRVSNDPVSGETKISYTDVNNRKHIVWFENLRSSAKKTDFLKSRGIDSIAYWAYSYF